MFSAQRVDSEKEYGASWAIWGSEASEGEHEVDEAKYCWVADFDFKVQVIL
jgi:hypothetical protein